MKRLYILKANAIVFISSFCTLVLELVAGRIMAPYLGVSLYTWTSIIGVVLAGISLGNYLGGKLADRRASERTLGVLLFLGGLASLAVAPATQLVMSAHPPGLPLMVRIVLLTAAIFFLPSFVLGMVSPMVVKLTLLDLGQTGNVVGRIYAFSTLGSIIGTFATGFVLISQLGTRTILWVIAAVLMATAVLAAGMWRRVVVTVVFLGLFAGGYIWAADRGAFAAPCLTETDYYCININEQDNGRVKALVLDHLIHSYVSLDDPTRLEYGYEKVYADVTQLVAASNPAFSTMFIGGGGYTFPRYLEALYPRASIEVMEIDPRVTEVVYDQLGLARDTRIVTHNQDARLFLQENAAAGKGRYDLFYGDAFNDLSVPYHLTTREFAALVKSYLKPGGIYMINVIDNMRTGSFLRAFGLTLQQEFASVQVLSLSPAWDSGGQNTYILVASDRPVDEDVLKQTVLATTGKTAVSSFMPRDRWEAYLQQEPRIVLTDDYAPVDNLVAHLFEERGF